MFTQIFKILKNFSFESRLKPVSLPTSATCEQFFRFENT